MKTIIQDQETLLQTVTDELCFFFKNNPEAVFTMAAGRTMLPLWERLSEANASGRFSLAGTSFFQMAEFRDCPAGKSLRTLIEEGLLDKTDQSPKQRFWLDGKQPEDCDEAIRNAGGLDLAVLGIGNNAHIGFNEPATPYASRCRIQRLTDKTKNQLAWRFGTAESVPDYASTMGIRTLTEARKIMVLCMGADKAEATFRMLYARDDGIFPAAFLQMPYDVTVYADLEAGEKL